eukprot:3916805-Heterocapsa_arctica.AAC.1
MPSATVLTRLPLAACCACLSRAVFAPAGTSSLPACRLAAAASAAAADLCRSTGCPGLLG